MTAALHGRRGTVKLAALFLCVCALLVGIAAFLRAQSRPTGGSVYDQARKAINLGQYDQIPRLLGALNDPRAVALRARVDIDHGRYADAERLLTGPASAAPGSDAALELGKLQMYLGRRPEGRRTLGRVIQVSPRGSAADMVRIAQAEHGLAQYLEANESFKAANRLAPNDAVVNVAWGEMFVERLEANLAAQSFQIVLMAEPDNVQALVGMAGLTADRNPPEAKKQLDEALKLNSSYVPGHLLAAEIALDDGRRDDAKAALQKALEINPSSLEARSLDASIALLEGRAADFDTKVAAVLAINPRYGEVYRLAAEQASHNYRYVEAAQFARRAVAVDPESPRAYSSLGMQLLRTGNEAEARAALEKAFPDNKVGGDVVTLNLLTMLDALEKFETVRDGDLVMKFSPDEAVVMREAAVPFTKAAVETLSKQWEFTPAGPLLIEMFPKHDDFAVRTMGLPGMVGALGVCFGTVVVLDSPKARPPGDFSWQETLLHELTHVFTLQMSNNRVPRWLTEGISVWQERRGRPEWGRETHVPFAQALEQGKVLKLKDLNEGFQDPEMIVLSYYEASLVIDHLVKTYGEAKLRALLLAYGRGLDTDAALKDAFGATIDEIQTGFDASLDRDFASLRRALKKIEIPEGATIPQLAALADANPDSVAVQMRLAAERQKAGDTPAAIRNLERAAQLVPGLQGKQNPNLIIATLALEKNDTTRALQAFDAFLAVDGNDVEAARKRAQLLEPLGDAARTAAAYQRVVDVDPFDSHAQTIVGRMALQRRDAAAAIRAFRSALATRPPDEAAAHLDLAQAYFAGGQAADAKREVLAALEIAPSYEAAQELLLKVVSAQ